MEPYLTAAEGARRIRKGELVAFPTETVYGLGADALNPDAVLSIFEAKNRPSFNPIICHLPDAESVFAYGRASETARNLSQFWPGPMTLLLPHEGRIPSVVTSASELCGFRVPDHPLALELLRLTGRPVAAPSANISGLRSPTTAKMTGDQLGDRISGILDGGACQVGLESTVIRPSALEENTVEILRLGAITEEMLGAAGFIIKTRLESRSINETEALPAPGNLSAHYAPQTKMILLDLNSESKKLDTSLLAAAGLPGPENACSLIFGKQEPYFKGTKILNLSPTGDIHDAARNLFSFFDELDSANYEYILAHELPEEGLGRAINDRLRRASLYLGLLEQGQLRLKELHN